MPARGAGPPEGGLHDGSRPPGYGRGALAGGVTPLRRRYTTI